MVFSRLFSISSNPDGCIHDFGNWDGSKWRWKFVWNRNLRLRDEENLEHLLSLLDSIHLAIDGEDTYIWQLNKSGNFSVKSITMELAKSAAHLPPSPDKPKKLWAGLIPPRIEIFTWLALLGKLNSRDRLLKLKIIEEPESKCPLCLEHLESSDHLLLLCSFSWKIWSWWLKIWDLNWSFPSYLKEAFAQWSYPKPSPFFRKIWCAIFPIIIWSIWKERNSRIFNNVSCSISQIQDLILLRLCWWLKGWGMDFPYSHEDVIRNPYCLNWNGLSGMCGFPKVPKQISLWSPPPNGWIKWNVDASFDPAISMSATRRVLHNSNGLFMCLFSCPVPPIEINSAEILAIFRATQISMAYENLQKSSIIIESDSANAVKWCNCNEGGPWNLKFQLNFIRNAREKWLDLSIIHKGRESNVVADSLAKQGLRRDAEFLAWL